MKVRGHLGFRLPTMEMAQESHGWDHPQRNGQPVTAATSISQRLGLVFFLIPDGWMKEFHFVSKAQGIGALRMFPTLGHQSYHSVFWAHCTKGSHPYSGSWSFQLLAWLKYILGTPLSPRDSFNKTKRKESVGSKERKGSLWQRKMVISKTPKLWMESPQVQRELASDFPACGESFTLASLLPPQVHRSTGAFFPKSS